jgi:hypothetical protein
MLVLAEGFAQVANLTAEEVNLTDEVVNLTAQANLAVKMRQKYS